MTVFEEGKRENKQRQRRCIGYGKVEVEKRISPLRGSQEREQLRSK